MTSAVFLRVAFTFLVRSTIAGSPRLLGASLLIDDDLLSGVAASGGQVVYGTDDDGQLVRAPDTSDMRGQGEYTSGPRMSYSGGAGLLSTASDYARFLEAMRGDGSLNGHRLLGRKSVQLMTVDHLDSIDYRPGMGFGLGFSVVEDLGARGFMGSVGTFAWGGAYHTTYWVDPAEDLVVTYMTQLIPARDADDQTKLRTAIYGAIE